ncbi:MAG: DNA polymerase III subunit beta, partial [Candidatus Kerfeldbacteria bacterium]|nr:DNA polymerase III subunit beta [Candidatus Kerfeldbacteria bacterium]
TVRIRAKVDEPGKYTIPSRLLTEFIGLLGNEKVELETTEQGLRVVSGHSETTIKGAAAEDFPVLPSHQPTTSITLPASALRQALEGVIFASASDESRPEISGILFRTDAQHLIVAATDSYRLAERRVATLSTEGPEQHSIIPSRTAQEILRLTPEDDTVITLRLGDNQAQCLLPDTEVLSRVIEGQYPDYHQIIPTAWSTKASCDSQELLANVRATSLFCKPGINDLALTLSPEKKQILLSAANTQLGQHQGSLPATIEWPTLEMVFNYRYLLEGVQSLGGDDTILEFQDQNSPGLLRNPKRPDALYLLMPIRQ